MNKERRLGRGLESLLSRAGETVDAQGHAGGEHAQEGPGPRQGEHAAPPPGPEMANVYDLERNPYQPREDFDDGELQSLANSLSDHGLLQPLVVRRVEGRFQLVAGERRLRAAIKAGWTEVPVKVVDVDDRQLAELAIVENLQRKDLGPLEKAASFQRYIETHHCTQEDLANRLKIDRSTVANLIRLLELPGSVRDALRTGAITQGHARALLPLDNQFMQSAFCARVQTESLSVREVEAMVREVQSPPPAADEQEEFAEGGEPHAAAEPTEEQPHEENGRSEHIAALEQELRTALGTRVEVRESGRGRGRIVIHFNSHEEFERLHQHVAGPSDTVRGLAG